MNALVRTLDLLRPKLRPDSFADLAEKLLPGVVNISSSQNVQARGERPTRWRPARIGLRRFAFI